MSGVTYITSSNKRRGRKVAKTQSDLFNLIEASFRARSIDPESIDFYSAAFWIQAPDRARGDVPVAGMTTRGLD